MRDRHSFFTPPLTSCRRALDAAVPGQEWAKHVLEVEAALIPRPQNQTPHRPAGLRPRPVLLLGNKPGSIHGSLGLALAQHYRLPFQQVNLELGGFCVETTLSALLRQRSEFSKGQVPGVVVVTGLEHLDPAHAARFAGAIASTQSIPTAFRATTIDVCPAEVFWIAGLAIPEPIRRGTPFRNESLSYVAVGDGVTEVVAARFGGQEHSSVEDLLRSLEPAFKKVTWLLPYDRHDLLAQLKGPNSPVAEFSSWCAGHGVDVRIAPGAFEALVDLAVSRGGTLDDLELAARDAFEPVLPFIADASSRVARVVLSREAAIGEAIPILEEGPRSTIVLEADPIPTRDPRFPEGLPVRPGRTPNSNPEIRLASANDLAQLLINEQLPEQQ
jgi:hypothetical protein